jgi:hypothetical protein
VAQVTAQALTQQNARLAAMKRELTVFSRMQARTKMIIDTIQVIAGTDPTKLVVFALE